jgi:hypothetical protein
MAEEPDNAEANGHGGSILDALKSKELLLPAALSAVGAVAASKGPDLVRKLTEETEQKGEEEAERMGKRAAEGAKSGIAGKGALGKIASKALPGGGSGSGGKKTRRLPIQRWTDVAVPVERAYEEWTNFNDFPKFMHRVLNVEQKDDEHLEWQEKIWFSTRQWEGEITDRRKNDRIAWKTTKGTSHSGVVSFHKLDSNLTRVLVTLDFQPNGVLEKMASGMRFVKRAVQADLARFKAYCEFGDAQGIDYAQPGESDQGEDAKDEGGGGELRSSGGNGNGNGKAAEQSDEQSDEEREQQRRQRAERREERRGS